MAFRVPTFNLFADIYRGNGQLSAYGLPDVHSPCFLSMGRRVIAPVAKSAGVPAPFYPVEIGFPKLTDVRSLWNGTVQDVIEVPAGSKRFYTPLQVDDVAKGYSNEYRLVLGLYQVLGNPGFPVGGGPFPAPVPLP